MAGRRFMILAAALPTLAFYVLWVGAPMAYTFVMSFYEWNPILPERPFVGLDNYQQALFRDPLVIKCLLNTAYYTIVTVPVRMILALVAAVMVNSLPRGKGLYRITYFLPAVTSVVATSVMWKWLYQPRFGFINQIIGVVVNDVMHLNIDNVIPWLTNTRLAMPSVMIMSIWGGLGFTMVLFMAGLTSIPTVFYEAARIDGAGRLALFRHVTIPLLAPTTVFVFITGIIGALQVFTQMYMLTQGGPMNMTKPIVYHLYLEAFGLRRFGYASALAYILFAIILVLTLAQLRLTRTRWEY